MEDRKAAAVSHYREVCHQMAEIALQRGAGHPVRLVGVTKTIEPEIINAVLDDGLHIIGENRVQEFLEKKDRYHLNGVSVHFIGALQRNKVKYIVDAVDMIESVDSVLLAEEISKRAQKIGKVMPVLIEINIDEQESKSGLLPREAVVQIRKMAELPGISVKGLMCIPDPGKTPGSFKRMQTLQKQIEQVNIPNISMEELSMGMSGDYKEAILYGATLIRVGRGIFGERKHAF